MGNQIIRQPSGQFAIYSSVTSTIIMWDATAAEVVGWFADRAAQTARRDARRDLNHVKAGNARAAYFKFALTWEQARRADREHGGTASLEAS